MMPVYNYTTLDDPLAAEGTFAYGINTSGQIVGYYQDSNLNKVGFVYSGGTFTTFNVGQGINDGEWRNIAETGLPSRPDQFQWSAWQPNNGAVYPFPSTCRGTMAKPAPVTATLVTNDRLDISDIPCLHLS